MGSMGAGLRAGWAATAVLLLVGVVRDLRDPLSAPVPSAANTAATLGQDFRDATYYPVKDFLAGGIPYEPRSMLGGWPVRQEFDLYAPYHLLLSSPYALLGYRSAYAAFALLSLAMVVVTTLLAARHFRLPGGWLGAWVAAALVVDAQFTKAALYFGQVDPWCALGSTLALTQLHRSRWWCAIGVAMAWEKPQYGIPLSVLLLARRGWREAVAGGGIAAAASLPAVVVLVHRAGGVGAFVDVVRRDLAYANAARYSAVDAPTGARVDLAAVAFRVTGWLPPGAELGAGVLVLGIAAAAVAARHRRGLPLVAAEVLAVTLAMRLGIYHLGNEGMLHLAGALGVAALWLRGHPPPVAVRVGAVLAMLPGLYVAAAQRLVLQHLGARVDSLVEPGCVLVAYVLVCGSLLLGGLARRAGRADRAGVWPSTPG